MTPVGIPREIKVGEKRVGMTPEGACCLKEAGIPVLVETGAGEGSGFSDKDYQDSGCEIVPRPSELYQRAGFIKKVKEPLRPEWDFLRPHQLFFCYLHLASPENRELVGILLKSRVTALGLETVEKNGRTLLLEPMSEIAGALAAYYAGFFRQMVRVEGGRIIYPPSFLEKLERLAKNFPEVPKNLPPGKGVVFGGGTVGRKAVETLLKMGGEVDLVEKRPERRSELKKEFSLFKPRFRVWDPGDNLAEILEGADTWLGCVHKAGERALQVLSREELLQFSKAKKKLILDIAADQGGNFPETRPTTYESPLFLDSGGNLRFGVTNIPSLAGRGASLAIEKASLPYTLALARDWRKALKEFPELRPGLQIAQGKLLHEAVARAHHLSWESLREDDLLPYV